MTEARCSVDGCEKAATAKARVGPMCPMHATRWYRHGDVGGPERVPPGPKMRSALDRFWEKVDVRGPDECWPWTGGLTDSGYGCFHPTTGQRVPAHVFSYNIAFGPVAVGLQLDHLCHTFDGLCPGGRSCPHRRCVNPRHADPVEPAENKRRQATRMYCKRGHPFDEENTYITPNGHRRCRACVRERQRRSA